MSEKNITADDVVAEAKNQGLINDATIPAQGNESGHNEDSNEQPELTVIEGGKKTLKDRLKSTIKTVKDNKKPILITLGVIGAVTFTAVKFAAKTVVEEIVENADENSAEDGEAPASESDES
jgi:hypothetical protein